MSECVLCDIERPSDECYFLDGRMICAPCAEAIVAMRNVTKDMEERKRLAGFVKEEEKKEVALDG